MLSSSFIQTAPIWSSAGEYRLFRRTNRFSFWTVAERDVLGTKEKLTFNWRHQMTKKETGNTNISPAYKQVTEIVYDPDHELPTKETMTPITGGVVEGSPQVTHRRHDRYGNFLTTLSHGGLIEVRVRIINASGYSNVAVIDLRIPQFSRHPI